VIFLIDTSILVLLLKDREGLASERFKNIVGDCCIAQAALNANLALVHNDRDFRTITKVRPLMEIGFTI